MGDRGPGSRPTTHGAKRLPQRRSSFPRVTAFRGHLAESGETLLRFFRLDDEISLAFDPIVHYAQRRSDEDTRVAAYQEMVAQVTRFAVELQSAAAFETPELLAIDDETLNRPVRRGARAGELPPVHRPRAPPPRACALG